MLSTVAELVAKHAGVLRVVDRGPAADSGKAAAAFRQLWGDRAEMRRFPDGTISEAVAWDDVPPAQRSSIPERIVAHILQLHMPGAQVCPARKLTHRLCHSMLFPCLSLCPATRCLLSLESSSYFHILRLQVEGTSHLLTPALAARSDLTGTAPAVVAHTAIDAALQTISHRLRQLADLSLSVISTQAFGAEARHTACIPVQAHPALRATPARGLDADVLRCVEPLRLLVRCRTHLSWHPHSNPRPVLRMGGGLSLRSVCTVHSTLEVRVSIRWSVRRCNWRALASGRQKRPQPPR